VITEYIELDRVKLFEPTLDMEYRLIYNASQDRLAYLAQYIEFVKTSDIIFEELFKCDDVGCHLVYCSNELSNDQLERVLDKFLEENNIKYLLNLFASKLMRVHFKKQWNQLINRPVKDLFKGTNPFFTDRDDTIQLVIDLDKHHTYDYSLSAISRDELS